MNICLRKCCCAFFCCTCCRQTPLNVLTNQTILLPKNEATKDELETEQLFIYGSVPEELKTVLLEGYGPNPVKKIVCGKYHSIILLTNNRLIGFGLNDLGQWEQLYRKQSGKDYDTQNVLDANFNSYQKILVPIEETEFADMIGEEYTVDFIIDELNAYNDANNYYGENDSQKVSQLIKY